MMRRMSAYLAEKITTSRIYFKNDNVILQACGHIQIASGV